MLYYTYMDSSGTSVDKLQLFQEKVNKAAIPSDLKQDVLERIERLHMFKTGNTTSNGYSIEYDSLISYVNWLLRLPWELKSQDMLDLQKAKEILDKNHYGLTSVKDRILEYLATLALNMKNNNVDNALRAPILCLVGLAGTGKTTLASSIAESLGRRFERIPFGGMGDARSLRGQSRAFPDAEPGFIIRKLVSSQTKNCVILLDELDRVSEQGRSDIMGVLVELLDPEQNKAFLDHYINYPFDLSSVLFVATSNNTTNISTAVLDRLEIIQMPSYNDEEKMVISKKYLFPKIMQQTGLLANQLALGDDVWPLIIRPLGYDSGTRSLERTIEGICRRVARLIIEGKTQSVSINSTNIKEFIS